MFLSNNPKTQTNRMVGVLFHIHDIDAILVLGGTYLVPHSLCIDTYFT